MTGTDAETIIHRYAIWCAARASSTKNCRFRVEKCASLIESSEKLRFFYKKNRQYLTNYKEFDNFHDVICSELTELANKMDISNFKYGIAAKIVNIYLKTVVVIPMLKYLSNLSENEKFELRAIHPPIDRVLLKELAKKNVSGEADRWRRYKNIGWTNFSQMQYMECIKLLRSATDGKSWSIEKYWLGYQ